MMEALVVTMLLSLAMMLRIDKEVGDGVVSARECFTLATRRREFVQRTSKLMMEARADIMPLLRNR